MLTFLDQMRIDHGNDLGDANLIPSLLCRVNLFAKIQPSSYTIYEEDYVVIRKDISVVLCKK